MKILTVKQPWAWLIIHAGKNIENRGWETSYRGPLLIQSSAKRPPEWEMRGAIDYALARGVAIPMSELRYGGIVGRVDLVRCVRQSESPWFMGEVGWVLENPQRLPFTSIRGQLGLFDASLKLLAQLGITQELEVPQRSLDL